MGYLTDDICFYLRTASVLCVEWCFPSGLICLLVPVRYIFVSNSPNVLSRHERRQLFVSFKLISNFLKLPSRPGGNFAPLAISICFRWTLLLVCAQLMFRTRHHARHFHSAHPHSLSQKRGHHQSASKSRDFHVCHDSLKTHASWRHSPVHGSGAIACGVVASRPESWPQLKTTGNGGGPAPTALDNRALGKPQLFEVTEIIRATWNTCQCSDQELDKGSSA